MVVVFILFAMIIVTCTVYLNKFKKRSLGFFFTSLIIALPTTFIYFKKGNIESYFFKDKIDQIVEDGSKNPEKFKEISPEILVLYLEEKLKKKPNDLQGWLILARTCVLGGYYQKADKYYKNALKNFPLNEDILLEYAILKKNSNQTKSAKDYLYKLKSLSPNNLKAREVLIEILINNLLHNEAKKELNQLFDLMNDDEEYIRKIKKKFKLN